MVQVNKII